MTCNCPIKLCLLLLFFVLSSCATVRVDAPPKLQVGTESAPVEIWGVQQQDLLLGGIIHLTRDLYIPVGRSLSVAPGSKIIVLGSDSTKIDPEFLDKGTEILVKGTITLAGQPGLPITISLDTETPEGENWTGIELINAESAFISHVDIFDAEIGILSLDSSPELQQVNILSSRYGLLLQGGGQLNYVGGRISGGDAGILCFDHSALTLNQIHIVDNMEEGLYLAKGCSLNQQNVQIKRNDLGAVASDSYRENLQSSLQDNRIDFKPLPAEVHP